MSSRKASRESSRDTLNLRQLVSDYLPTKAEREAATHSTAETQAKMTESVSNAIAEMSANRGKEIEARKDMALAEMRQKKELYLLDIQVQNQKARSAFILELVKAGVTPAAAEELAMKQMPDIRG
ncbi:hypothetical protein DFH28DRAFT_910179 [Melampsora americana]|nr:hypothetical protein DFH28DRAFT_910179 [Melampsora americana]